MAHPADWMAEGSYGVMTHYLITPEGQTEEEKTAAFNKTVDNFDLDKMTRDTMENLGGEASWLVPIEKIKEERDARAAQIAEMEEMKKADAMAGLADKAAGAGAKAAGAVPMLPQLQAMFGQQQQGQQEQPIDPLDDFPDVEDPFADMMAGVQ